MELLVPKIFNLWDIYNILSFPRPWFTTDSKIMMNHFTVRLTVEQLWSLLPVEIIVPVLTLWICKTIVTGS